MGEIYPQHPEFEERLPQRWGEGYPDGAGFGFGMGAGDGIAGQSPGCTPIGTEAGDSLGFGQADGVAYLKGDGTGCGYGYGSDVHDDNDEDDACPLPF